MVRFLVLAIMLMASTSLAQPFKGGTAEAAYDTLTAVFVWDNAVAGHSHAEYASDMAAADLTVDLSDAGTHFSYTVIDSVWGTGGLRDQDGNAIYRMQIQSTTQETDFFHNNLSDVGGERRVELVYIPFEDHLPKRAQIIDAKIKYSIVGNWYKTVHDTMMVTLMSSPADTVWFKTTNQGMTNPTNYTKGSYASYRHQRMGRNSYGYPAPTETSYAWNPSLQDRPRFWDWGDYHDGTGWPAGNVLGSYATPVDNNITITNCVQAAVNGKTNYGMALHLYGQSSNQASYIHAPWEPDGTYDNPAWVTVRYLTRKYVSPWPNGYDMAAPFCSDDGMTVFNQTCADTFRAHGGKWTAYIIGKYLNEYNRADNGLPLRAHMGKWVDWYNEGLVELGSHSYFHPDDPDGVGNHLGGLAAHNATWTATPFVSATEYTLGMYPDTLTAAATGLDSLLYDTDPTWMYYEFGQLTGEDWTDRPNFGETIGNPVWTPDNAGLAAIAAHSWVGARIQFGTKQTLDIAGPRIGSYDARVETASRTATASPEDTLYSGLRPNHMNNPRNISMWAMTNSTPDFVDESHLYPSYDTVFYNAKLRLELQRAAGTRVFATFAHGQKSGTNSTYVSGAMDPMELGAILDACDSVGGGLGSWYPTYSELIRWVKKNSTIIATPATAGWDHTALYRYTAADSVWARLDGKYGTFIPGVKP